MSETAYPKKTIALQTVHRTDNRTNRPTACIRVEPYYNDFRCKRCSCLRQRRHDVRRNRSAEDCGYPPVLRNDRVRRSRAALIGVELLRSEKRCEAIDTFSRFSAVEPHSPRICVDRCATRVYILLYGKP